MEKPNEEIRDVRRSGSYTVETWHKAVVEYRCEEGLCDDSDACRSLSFHASDIDLVDVIVNDH